MFYAKALAKFKNLTFDEKSKIKLLLLALTQESQKAIK